MIRVRRLYRGDERLVTYELRMDEMSDAIYRVVFSVDALTDTRHVFGMVRHQIAIGKASLRHEMEKRSRDALHISQ